MLLERFFSWEVMGVLVTLPVSKFRHERSRRVSYVHGNRKISEFRNVRFHFLHGDVYAVVFRRFCQIVREPAKLEFGFRHAHLFANVVNHVRVKKGLRIRKSYVFRGEIEHSSGNVAGILASSEHSADVIYRRVALRIAQ